MPRLIGVFAGRTSFCWFCHEAAHVKVLWGSWVTTVKQFTRFLSTKISFAMLMSWVDFPHFHVWATSWQNQQMACGPSEDSDQPGHPPSLIRVFAVGMKKAWFHWFCNEAAHFVIFRCITGATTFCSGVGYVWSRNSYVKFLRKGMERKFWAVTQQTGLCDSWSLQCVSVSALPINRTRVVEQIRSVFCDN